MSEMFSEVESRSAPMVVSEARARVAEAEAEVLLTSGDLALFDERQEALWLHAATLRRA